MEIWSELKSFEEMQAAVNIPVTILDKMHTADLVATCLEYPLFPVISAYNSRQKGFEVLYEGFNGFKELGKRPDAGKFLIERYIMLNPMEVQNSQKLIKKGTTIYDFLFIEMLSSQKFIAKQLNRDQQLMLLKEAVAKIDQKASRPDVFSIFSISSSAVLAAALLSELEKVDSLSYNQTDEKLVTLLTRSFEFDGKAIVELKLYAEVYLNRN